MLTASKRRHDPFCVRAECDQNSRSRNKQRENTQRAATNLGTSNLSVCFFRLPTPCAPPRVHGVSPAQPVLLPCPLSAGSPPDCLVGIPLVALAAHPHAPSPRVVILDGDGRSAAGAPSGVACARVLFLEVLAMTVCTAVSHGGHQREWRRREEGRRMPFGDLCHQGTIPVSRQTPSKAWAGIDGKTKNKNGKARRS